MHWIAQQAEWLLGSSDLVHGIPVRIYAVETAGHNDLRGLLATGLDYLAKYGPRQYKQLRHRIRRMSICRLPHLHGHFEESGPTIVIAEDFLKRSAHRPVEVASTLVHEATHARLHRLGIRYTDRTYVRVEQACTQEELRFLSQVPEADAADLLQEVRSRFESAATLWSRDVDLARTSEALAIVDAPMWLRWFYRWLGSRRPAA